jgi:hypothetical protein
MAIQESQASYTFPRIPLNFSIPENYPELERISNISVIPEITDYHFTREEMEIKGSYQIEVSYFKTLPEDNFNSTGSGTTKCEFFGNIRVCSEGLIEDPDASFPEDDADTRELYTVQFSRPFHTFIDLEFIARPRSYRPTITIERADLDIAGKRQLKGELVLGVTNLVRRNGW